MIDNPKWEINKIWQSKESETFALKIADSVKQHFFFSNKCWGVFLYYDFIGK